MILPRSELEVGVVAEVELTDTETTMRTVAVPPRQRSLSSNGSCAPFPDRGHVSLSRRTLLTAAGLGALGACTSNNSSKSHSSDVPTTSPATPKNRLSSSAVSREEIIARYGDIAPTEWGINLPGVTTRLPTTEKVVALTFDACSGANGSGYDETLVNVLRKHQVPATLFLNNRWVAANLEMFRRLASDSLFEVGNHGTAHRPLSVSGRSAYGIAGTRDAGEVFDEVATNHIKLTQLLGQPPRFFRPGTAHCDNVATRIAADLGEQLVNFDINGDAGATFTAVQVEQAVLKARPGSIVIGHMNQPTSGTAQGIDAAIPQLTSSGFRFVQLSKYLP